MSEQKQHFMQKLDEWSLHSVIKPVFQLGQQYGKGQFLDQSKYEELEAEVLQQIRDKVYESWQNGRASAEKQK